MLPIDDPVGRAGLPLPRLIALDVDGTLLTSDHRLTEPTIRAVRSVRAAGVRVVLVSSRPPGALLPILLALGLGDPAVFVGSQGALTGTYSGDGELRIIDQRPMPAMLARTVVGAAADQGLAVNWYAGERWLVSHLDDQVRREARVVGYEPTVADLDGQEQGPDKLLVIAPDERRDALGDLSAAIPPGLRAQVSNPTYLEITRSDVDKAAALAAQCARQGIARESVVAIGDGPNDLGMLRFAGTAIAMSNAPASVREAVGLVTASNDEDGVARALGLLVPGSGAGG